MPPSYTDDQIVYAVRDGLIIPAQLDRMAQGMIDLVNKTRAAMSIDNYRFDVDAHDEVAHQAAIESIVMLKNDDAILPLNAGPVANPSATPQKIAVIGEFARTPRYQGGGSSHITPTKMTSFLDTLAERGIKADFAPGFTLDLEPADPALESEAVETAKNADVVLMFLGLPEAAESEGFDRDALDMPAKQITLLEQVAAANQSVVVVLSNGSVVSVAPWAKNAKGILESCLLGQAGGPALADVIFGQVSPSGKLAQSIPLDISDDPSTLTGRARKATSTTARACSSAIATTTPTARLWTTRSATA
jgi:beta-glucosidase